MIRLDTTTRKLQAVLAGAVTANQLPMLVSYSDKTATDYAGGTQVSNTNGATAVDICAAPGASAVRDIDTIDIQNADTAAVTLTVRYNDGGTLYTLFKATLSAGDQVTYVHGQGWCVLSSSGATKSGTTAASAVSLVPVGGISATDVQAAINELDTEKQPLNATLTGIAAGTLGAFSHRNKIIGHFDINQRALTSVADDTYCCDRWYALTESGNVTVVQVTDPESGAPFGWKLTQPDASPKRMGLATIIESKNVRAFRSAAMNFFMRVKPAFSGNVRYAILEHTGTADTVTSDIVNNWASTNFTASNFFIAGLSVIKTGVVAPGAATYGEFSDYGIFGASLNNAILFVWTESAQAQNATLELNRPQFEPGIIHTPHEWRMNEKELCQRYYEIGAIFTTPFTVVNGFVTAPYKVTKRVAPTIIVTASMDWTGAAAGTGTAGAGIWNSAETIGVTNSSNTSIGCTWTADSEI